MTTLTIRLNFIIVATIILSVFVIQKAECQSNSTEKQSNSSVSGPYEFKTSWLQSFADFKPDSTFYMSYTLSTKHETSGTWSINGKFLIIKNDDRFPANKKWLIVNEKLYPMLTENGEYDMKVFYISIKK